MIDQSHITWNIGCGTPVRFPVYSVLIEHPDGLFMFDSGYDLDLVNAVLPFELPEQTAEQTVPAQLARCGFKPEDVDAIINSHLHFDHCGGNKHLPERDDLPAPRRAPRGTDARAVRAARLRRPGMGPPRRRASS